MAELCRHYGISRKTGYKIVARWEQAGAAGLEDRSRAPQQHPNQTAEEIAAAVLARRRAHMRWGPRKLRRWLEDRHPRRRWPAASTIGELLRREGLAHARRLRRKTPPYTEPFAAADQANAVWCADFKGWFRTGDGEPEDDGRDGGGNLEISKTRDFQIPTAATTTATGINQPSNQNNPTPDENVLPICPV